ncbi:MAG: acetoacetate decarboxylase family protein [Candidatus Binataceae bacterium]
MPLSGSMDVQAFASNVKEIHGFKTEAWQLKDAQILHIHYEIDNETITSLLPVTLRPVIPAYGVFNITRYPDSPVGPFTIAEVRVGCRAGVRPRGFTLRSYVSTEAAARELARRWGYPAETGDVYLRAFHDRVVGRVKAGGKTVLEMEMLDRDFISGGDIQYVSSMQLCRNHEDGKLVVVQIDPEWVFKKAERGRPHIITLDSQAWAAGNKLRADYPISASYAIADVSLAPIRYVSDPNQDAFRGTTKVAA